MSEGLDLYAIALIVGVAALFGTYFWHVIREMFRYLIGLSAYLDNRAARQRAALEHEGLNGPVTALRRAGQVVSISLLVALCAYLAFRKFSLI